MIIPLKKLKLKEGDKAKVVANTSGHGYRMNTVVMIMEKHEQFRLPYYTCADALGHSWDLDDSELKKVKRKK